MIVELLVGSWWGVRWLRGNFMVEGRRGKEGKGSWKIHYVMRMSVVSRRDH
jgi:hypothetical protein